MILLLLALVQAPDSVQHIPVLRPVDSVTVWRTHVDTLPWACPSTMVCTVVVKDSTPRPPAGPQITSTAQLTAFASGTLGKTGDTVWVRAGKYPGAYRLNSGGKTLRCWPGERCTLGSLEIYGAGLTLWGLEIDGRIGASGVMGINCRAAGFRFINGDVHHAQMSGVGLWTECPNAEVAGSTIHDNGTHKSGGSCYDHGIYAQGKTGTRLIRDDLVVGNLCYGIHLYAGAPDQSLVATTVRRTIALSNPLYADLLVAVYTGPPAQGIVVDSSLIGVPDLGWVNAAAVKGKDLTIRGNAWQTAPTGLGNWASVTQSGNVLGWPATKVYANPYESGRGHTWTNGSAVDLSAILKIGQVFHVQQARDPYGPSVLIGTYTGPVTLPAGLYVVVGQ